MKFKVNIEQKEICLIWLTMESTMLQIKEKKQDAMQNLAIGMFSVFELNAMLRKGVCETSPINGEIRLVNAIIVNISYVKKNHSSDHRICSIFIYFSF